MPQGTRVTLRSFGAWASGLTRKRLRPCDSGGFNPLSRTASRSMFRSAWKLSFTFTDVRNVNRSGALQSEVFSRNFTLTRMKGRLTASPVAVYRCDLIERWPSFSYSVIQARGMYRRANFPVPEKGDPTWRLVRSEGGGGGEGG